MIHVMFVCHGNICRSPMAEFIFNDLIKKKNINNLFTTDSSATSYEEVGNNLYYKTKEILEAKGISYTNRKAKKFTQEDYRNFDYILVMDEKNKKDISHIIHDSNHKIVKLTHFINQANTDVLDPWYTNDFETCFTQIKNCLDGFLNYILLKKDSKAMTDDIMIEKKVRENLIYDGRIIQVYNDDVMLSNHKLVQREYVKHNGGACGLCYDENMDVYLVKQFRYPYHDFVLELPAGKLEINENPLEALKRELKEEIGVDDFTVESSMQIYPTVGYSNEIIYLYFVKIHKMSINFLDEDEFLNVQKYSLKELSELVNNNTIKDSKTIIGVLNLLMKNKNL